MSEESDFQARFRPEAPASVGAVLQRRQATPDVEELRQAAEEKAEAEERAERREQLAALNARAGNPLAELSRAQMQASEARELVDDLQGQLERARERLHRCAEAVVDFGHQVDDLYASTARRSDDSTFGAVKRAAAEAHVDALLELAGGQTGVTGAQRAALWGSLAGQHGRGRVSRRAEDHGQPEITRVTGWLG